MDYFRRRKTLSLREQQNLNINAEILYGFIVDTYFSERIDANLSCFNLNLDELSIFSLDQLPIRKRHFTRLRDMFDIGMVLHELNLAAHRNETILNILEFPLSCFIQIQTKFNFSNAQLKNLFTKGLDIWTFRMIDLSLPLPKNLFICRTSHPEADVPTFGTRIFSNDAKIIMGSPGMSAIIYEIFVFPHQSGIDLNRLKTLAQGTGTQIMQFAVSGRKRWIFAPLDPVHLFHLQIGLIKTIIIFLSRQK